MKTFKCRGGHRERPANPKVKEQNYCGRADCQRARRREWQRKKMATDPDYRENQRNSQKQWQEKNPDYWRDYRKNRQDPLLAAPSPQLAKMDTLLPNFHIIS